MSGIKGVDTSGSYAGLRKAIPGLNQDGLTLIELLVSLVILGLLS
jgi:prepilin-type N-terminal cleavage/methylation domain-containing protein